MSTPVVGLFSECPAETLHAVVLAVANLLARDGKRVVLVDADPATAPFQRLPEAPAGPFAPDWAAQPPQGASLLGMLRNVDLRPRVCWASGAVLDTRYNHRGSLLLVPALAAGEAPDPEALQNPPMGGARRTITLRQGLAGLEADLVLLVGPNTYTALGVALLAHGCHAAILMGNSTAREVFRLANMARFADARRGGVIPTLCIECRDYGEPVPEGAWTELWATDPRYLPPHRKGERGPEQLMILDDAPDTNHRLAAAVQALADRAQVDGLQRDDSAFAAIYQEDPAQAVALFREHIAPRQGTRTSAIESLRAVWDTAPRALADVQQLAKFVVQKFRWEDPTPDAEPLLPMYEAVLGAADAGELPGLAARARIDLAGMLGHAARWRQQQGQDAQPLLARAEALVLEAVALDRSPMDCGRAAEVLSLHARLVGDARHLELASQQLAGLRPGVPEVLYRQMIIDVVGNFARVQPSLWPRVRELCQQFQALNRRYALYNGAIAEVQLGRVERALELLHELGQIDKEAYLLAFRDPDFGPLSAGWRAALPPNPPPTR